MRKLMLRILLLFLTFGLLPFSTWMNLNAQQADRFASPHLWLTSGLSTSMKLALLPYPAKLEIAEGEFRLNNDFRISVEGEGSNRIYKGVIRTIRRLSERTGLFLTQDFTTTGSMEENPNMIIKVNRKGKVVLGEDESYSLKINSNKIYLTAETDIGALRGLETFLQLLSADEIGYFFPSVEISDYPRFQWRGLLIDVSRHFQPVEVIKHNLDGMAAVKMNVLHWHLTDDQGFRMECKTFPELHEMGSDGFYYTQEEIKDIIRYADERGIRVVPEFDIPAHSTSWFVSHPELASAPGPYKIERTWGIKDPVMDPTKEEVYQFLDKFFEEVSFLFTDEYIHIGGDENTGKHWDANEDIQMFMRNNNIKDNHALQRYFNVRVNGILRKYGKKMVGWDEIFDTDLPKDAVIQSWRGHDSLIKAAQSGFKCILSHGYYIDLIQPAEYHYLNDPLPEGIHLSEEEKRNILGGEATAWGELVSTETIDSRIWPRTAAIAERLWSPYYIKDVDDMYRRLEVISYQLEEHGLNHKKNYEMMLRRLTNNTDIIALKNLVDVVEPVKNYDRHFQGVIYTSHSPLTRVVDAARPESMKAREFRKLVDELISEGRYDRIDEIEKTLLLWKSNHNDILKTIKVSPILKEIETISEDLRESAEIGLKAIKYIKRKRKAPGDWVNRSLEFLNKAKRPRGEVELMVISPVEKLVLKAGRK